MKTHYAMFAVALAASSLASAQEYDDYARVIRAVPEYTRVNAPHQECATEYEPVVHASPERDYGGTIIGGIAGGVLGSQMGHGSGNRAATAVGAIAGAIIGDHIQNQQRVRYDRDEMREVRRCHAVDHWENRLTGYRVTYEYADREYTAVLPDDPGRRLRLRVNVEPLAGDDIAAARGW